MKLRSIHQAFCILLLPFFLLASIGNASADWPWSQGKIDFELTGTVLDKVTKEPIEGAYVFASYREQQAGMAAVTSWCVKTRGMYTGKDGKYHFPVEKLDGRSPFETSAIKPGYFSGFPVWPNEEMWKKQGREAYTGRDLLLIPQDPAKPDFHFGYGDESCNHAPTRQDAAAGVEFLKIKLSETIRLGGGKQGIDAIKDIIRSLESKPDKANLSK